MLRVLHFLPATNPMDTFRRILSRISPQHAGRQHKFDVCVVGSCNIDIALYVDELPQAGETVHSRDGLYHQCFGGKGANQAVQAARLGATTAMVARVGDGDNDDAFAQSYLEALDREHIDRAAVRFTPGSKTGIASIWVNRRTGQNSIVIAAGANNELSPADIDDAFESKIVPSKVVLMQLETPLATTAHLVRRLGILDGTRGTAAEGDSSLRTGTADPSDSSVPRTTAAAQQHRTGRKRPFVIFNPAPAPRETSVLTREFLQHIDIICPNEVEASLIAEDNVLIETIDDAFRAAKTIQRLGARHVILTLGERGVVYLADGSSEPMHIPAVKVKHVKDTTAAGDSFLGSLAAHIAKHLYGVDDTGCCSSSGDGRKSPSRDEELELEASIIRDAIAYAVRVAAVKVQRLGTQSSLPTSQEVQSYFQPR